MKCLSHRKLKRALNDKLAEEELRTPDLREAIKPLRYFSSEDMQIFPRAHQQDIALRTLPGEYIEPDPEIMDVAFSHKSVVTKKDLSDNGVYTSIDKMIEAQEWDEWWQDQDYNDLLKAIEIISAKVNTFKQKYGRLRTS